MNKECFIQQENTNKGLTIVSSSSQKSEAFFSSLGILRRIQRLYLKPPKGKKARGSIGFCTATK